MNLNINIRKIAAYTMLPSIIPWVTEMLPNTRMFAGLMAVVFGNVRLLPAGHPYLNPSRYGTFGLREVMAAAAHNLRPNIKQADQWIVYTAFLVGIILMLFQFIMLITMSVMSTAHAAGPFGGFFVTLYPQTDVAFLMLDRVFGIPNFFNSCFDPSINAAYSTGVCAGYYAPTAFPNTFQLAMQQLFAFYSGGILMIALLIIVYYFFYMLVNTLATGRPLGKGYQSFYTPIRLVLAVMLVIPMAHGYNLGQYLTLNAAKWGSSFATNAWTTYNNQPTLAATGNPLGLQTQNLTGNLKPQDISSIVNFMYLVKTCAAAYDIAYKGTKDIEPFFIVNATSSSPSSSVYMGSGSSFVSTLSLFKNDSIAITFGEKDTSKYGMYAGYVKPYCGQITMPVQGFNISGIDKIYNVHFTFIRDLWNYSDLDIYGKRMAYIVKFWDKKSSSTGLPTTAIAWGADNEAPAGSSFYVDLRLDRQSDFNSKMATALSNIRSTTPNPDLSMTSTILTHGWGGAGLWFNQIASYNGAMVDSLNIMPSPTAYPRVMEFVKNQKQKNEAKTPFEDRFDPNIGSSDGKPLSIQDFKNGAGLDVPETDILIAGVLNQVYQSVANSESTSKSTAADNKSPIKSFITFVLGDSGLFDLLGNSDVFPLARMAILGRSIIDKTVVMIGGGALMVGLGGIMGGANGNLGAGLSTFGDALLTMSTMALATGIILFYIIPFLPFMYFFMAVGRWVKSIFEAMVGVPLWGLAHLRFGGDSISGPFAAQGYLMILEIFLRPILTVFGLLAGMGIFAALATALDTIWSLIVYNVGGYDLSTLSSLGSGSTFPEMARESFDELFYTIIYVVVLYMMALSSFKMIDQIPSSVMRWLGSKTRGFSDGSEGSADQLIHNTADEAVEMVDQFKDQLNEGSQGIGGAGGELFKSTSRMSEKMRNS